MADPPVRTLLYFVRWPEPGLVKTRLAATVGAEEACRIHRLIAASCFHNARAVPATRLVVCGTGATPEEFAQWLPGADDYRQQPEGDLGHRLEALFGDAHTVSPDGVAAIGSDAPLMPPKEIETALDALNRHDVAFCPAEDGGYALVGTRRFFPELFRGIPWSTPETLNASLETCRRLSKSVFLGNTQRDVDTEEDWAQVSPLMQAHEGKLS